MHLIARTILSVGNLSSVSNIDFIVNVHVNTTFMCLTIQFCSPDFGLNLHSNLFSAYSELKYIILYVCQDELFYTIQTNWNTQV